MIALFLAAGVLLASTPAPKPAERSLALDGEYLAPELFDESPTARSAANALEHALPNAVLLTEDSGGFSAIDPERLSLFGGSALWTTWTWNHYNLSDPFFSGAAALRIPARMIDTFGLRYAETPNNELHEGPSLYTDPKDTHLGPSASATLTLPHLGGFVPFAVGVMRAFSGSHPTKRDPAPPDERRQFSRRLTLDLLDTAQLADTTVRWGTEVDLGARNFLEFTPVDGNYAATFNEPYFLISGAAVVTPKSETWSASFAAEYRQRNNLYAELHYAEEETLAEDALTLFAGYEGRNIRANATLKYLRLEHQNPSFTRDLLDPDGEGFNPYFPDGQILAALIDARWQRGPLFVHAIENLQTHFAAQNSWTHALTTGNDPYGRLELRSGDTLIYSGEQKAGVTDTVELQPFRLDYSIFATLALSADSGGKNALFLPDAGAKMILAFKLDPNDPESFEPFLALAKIPLPISLDLTRKLDPDWLSGEYYLSEADAPIDVLGGEHLTVSPALVRPNSYSGGLGMKIWPGAGWRLTLQGLFRAYKDTPWLELEGGPSAHGGTDKNGRYYFNEGERNYVLVNYPDHRPPFYAGFHLQLFKRSENFLFELSFAALNAIANTAFGNGATSNDLGIVDESTGNPNSAIEGVANLDGDRAFLFKLLVGYRVFEGFWLSALVRHKDGQPFAFFDDQTQNNQLSRAYASNRGSPLKYSRPLAGPREDFQLEMSLLASYEYSIAGLGFLSRVECSNLFDFGNELQERSTPVGRNTRATLEQQIPRALIFSQLVRF